MINDIDHFFFFICLLAICISSLEKLQFNCLAHSKMRLSDMILSLILATVGVPYMIWG